MKRPWSLGRSLSISFFVHLVLLMAWIHYRDPKIGKMPRTEFKVELTSFEKKPDPLLRSKSRMVQTQMVDRGTPPSDPTYLGQQDQMVDRETVSRSHDTRMGRESVSNQSQKKTLSLSELGVKLFPKDYPSLPSPDSPQRSIPGARPGDFIAGMRESDRTVLNTREFKFYSYFQRVRGRLEQAWYPIIKGKVEKYYRSGGHLASEYEYTTRALVFLNKAGEIKRVQIVESSGKVDLDDAAVRAFNEAGPFPNPPTAMIGDQEEIEIPWDFVLRS